MVPDDGSTSGVISTPFSMIFDTSKTASDIATEIHIDASARCKPVYQSKKIQSAFRIDVVSVRLLTWANTIQDAKSSNYSATVSNGNSPSPKTEADGTGVNFRLFSIPGEEALRCELVGFRVCPGVMEHEPIEGGSVKDDEWNWSTNQMLGMIRVPFGM